MRVKNKIERGKCSVNKSNDVCIGYFRTPFEMVFTEGGHNSLK